MERLYQTYRVRINKQVRLLYLANGALLISCALPYSPLKGGPAIFGVFDLFSTIVGNVFNQSVKDFHYGIYSFIVEKSDCYFQQELCSDKVTWGTCLRYATPMVLLIANSLLLLYWLSTSASDWRRVTNKIEWLLGLIEGLAVSWIVLHICFTKLQLSCLFMRKDWDYFVAEFQPMMTAIGILCFASSMCVGLFFACLLCNRYLVRILFSSCLVAMICCALWAGLAVDHLFCLRSAFHGKYGEEVFISSTLGVFMLAIYIFVQSITTWRLIKHNQRCGEKISTSRIRLREMASRYARNRQ